VVKPSSGVGLVAAEQAAAAFLVALGVDLDSESLAATPSSESPAAESTATEFAAIVRIDTPAEAPYIGTAGSCPTSFASC
jgi:hypothetical protein